MNLIQQVITELGGDFSKSYTILPGFGGYFQSVKRILEYGQTLVILQFSSFRLRIEGQGLTIGKYFEHDLFLRGKIEGVHIE